MRPIHLFVLACYAVAALLFFLVGFDIVDETEYNLVAIGLGVMVAGYTTDRFIE